MQLGFVAVLSFLAVALTPVLGQGTSGSCSVFMVEMACTLVNGCTWSGTACSGTYNLDLPNFNISTDFNISNNLNISNFNISNFNISIPGFGGIPNIGSLLDLGCSMKTPAECAEAARVGVCKVEGNTCKGGSFDMIPVFNPANFSGDFCNLIPNATCANESNGECEIVAGKCIAKAGTSVACLKHRANCTSCLAAGCTYRFGSCFVKDDSNDAPLSCDVADKEQACFGKSDCSSCRSATGCCWAGFVGLCAPCGGRTQDTCDAAANVTVDGDTMIATNGTVVVPGNKFIVINSTRGGSDLNNLQGNGRVDGGITVNRSLTVDGTLQVNQGGSIRADNSGSIRLDNQGSSLQFSPNSSLVLSGGSLSGNGVAVFLAGSLLSVSATTANQSVPVNARDTLIQIANGVRLSASDAASAGKNPVVTFNGPSIFTGGDMASAAQLESQSHFLALVRFEDKSTVNVGAPTNFAGSVLFTGSVRVNGNSSADFASPVNVDSGSSVVVSSPASFSGSVQLNSSSSLIIASPSGKCSGLSQFVMNADDASIVLQNPGFNFDNNCNLASGKGVVRFGAPQGTAVVHVAKRSAYGTDVRIDANSTLDVNQTVAFQDDLVISASSFLQVRKASSIIVSNKVQFESGSTLLVDSSTNNTINTKDVDLAGTLRVVVPDGAGVGTRIVVIKFSGKVSGSFSTVAATTVARKRSTLEAGTWAAKTENGTVFIEKTSSTPGTESAAVSSLPNMVTLVLGAVLLFLASMF